MELQKLTVHHYCEDVSEERRITLAPGNITVIAAGVEDVLIGNRSLRNVTVMFLDGGSIDITINHEDMEQLEAAVGSYCYQ